MGTNNRNEKGLESLGFTKEEQQKMLRSIEPRKPSSWHYECPELEVHIIVKEPKDDSLRSD